MMFNLMRGGIIRRILNVCRKSYNSIVETVLIQTIQDGFMVKVHLTVHALKQLCAILQMFSVMSSGCSTMAAIFLTILAVQRVVMANDGAVENSGMAVNGGGELAVATEGQLGCARNVRLPISVDIFYSTHITVGRFYTF